MTKKEFFNAVSNGKIDILQIFLNKLDELSTNYCVIGGLGVNAYVEPVVSLDLDIVLAVDKIDEVCDALKDIFKIERFTHSINLNSSKSDLRIQLQTDPRYQDFLQQAATHIVLGYTMKVASIEDVLRGKIWAYLDEQRRKSKRQKDLADILRLIETYPKLSVNLPDSVRNKIEI